MTDFRHLPYVDADIVAYESCYAGQYIDEETKELKIVSFQHVKDRIEQVVADLMDKLETNLEPVMFLTGEGNFREEIAVKKGYKENRDKSKRPYHLANAREYIKARFNTYVSKGCEADDLICTAATENNEREAQGKTNARAVICTRDKDLRQVEGWHYGWESGKQAEFPLQWLDSFGELLPKYKEVKSPKTGKVSQRMKDLGGTGMKWFYAQMLMGDKTDNIPGLKGYGPVKVFKLLNKCKDEQAMLDVVCTAYKQVYGIINEEPTWWYEMFEQARLVWMIRERNEDGTLKHWDIPEGCDVSKFFE